jgi:hypothetical protein
VGFEAYGVVYMVLRFKYAGVRGFGGAGTRRCKTYMFALIVLAPHVLASPVPATPIVCRARCLLPGGTARLYNVQPLTLINQTSGNVTHIGNYLYEILADFMRESNHH